MATTRQYEQFEQDFGYRPCFKVWSSTNSNGTHRCAKKDGHDEECVCHCGSRQFWPHPEPERFEIKTAVTLPKRPTIEELEKILQREPDAPIEILPDGTIKARDPATI